MSRRLTPLLRLKKNRQNLTADLLLILQHRAMPTAVNSTDHRYRKSEMANTVKIEGKDYELDQLSDNARAQIVNLNVTDQEIARLQARLAIAQTARASYAKALKQELDKAEPRQ